MEFISLTRSDDPAKKYMVRLKSKESGREKTVHFGDASMKDYTLFSAEERAERKRSYLSRHRSREDWNDPSTAGFWARHILWGDTPSVRENLKLTKRRFNL
jgi:hypothetical protein